MLSMLVAYNAQGEVFATLDFMVKRDENGEVVGMIDFSAYENEGKPLTDLWDVSGATGSGTWPEWLGAQAHDFSVERVDGKVAALIHRNSGIRREREDVERRIAQRIEEAGDKPADIRDIVGGPGKPLVLDEDGRTKNKEDKQK